VTIPAIRLHCHIVVAPVAESLFVRVAVETGIGQAALELPAVGGNKISIAAAHNGFAPASEQCHVGCAHVFGCHDAPVFSRHAPGFDNHFRRAGCFS